MNITDFETQMAAAWAGNKTSAQRLRKLALAVEALNTSSITALTTHDLQLAAQQLAATRSPATVNTMMRCLSTALNYAVANNWISSAPAYKSLPSTPKPIEAFSELEVSALLMSLAATQPDSTIHHITVVCLQTGIRYNEIHELISSFDVTACTSTLTATKSCKVRVVHLSATAISSLQFLSETSKTLDYQTARLNFTAACTAAGVSNYTLHSLRHTCISTLVRKGIDPFQIQKFIGHSTIQQTMRYVHHAYNHANILAVLGGSI